MGKKTKAEMVVAEPTAPARATPSLPSGIHPETLIQQAIDKNVPVETIEKLLAMRKELRAEAAKEAYDVAMAKLQGEMPVIKKTKIVKDKNGVERYRYAPIDAIIDQTKEYIARNGFSYAVTTEQSEVAGEVKAICTVKHEMGHSESSTFRVPIDKEAYMSGPQKVGAALTFAKRYAFCNAFGIITGDDDTDATDENNPVGSPPVRAEAPKPVAKKTREELMRELHALLATYKMPHKAFNDAYQVSSMNDITDDLIVAAIAKLRERTKKGEVWKSPEAPKTPPDEPKQPWTPETASPAPETMPDAKTEATVEDGEATLKALEEGGLIRKGMREVPPPPVDNPNVCSAMIVGKPCGRPMPCAYHPKA